MKKTQNNILNHNGGFWEVLKIALPLILASSAHAINLLSDRIMLEHYSETAVAGSMPAGVTAFTLSTFFLGIINYTGTFVAQYIGARAKERVGVCVWQAIIFSLIGGAILATGWFWGNWFFSLLGHNPAVVPEEVAYFRVLSVGQVALLLCSAFSAFYVGRGKTAMIMIVNFIVTLVNIPFNYALIYGNWGCPELGIAGAGWGTTLSNFIGAFILASFFFIPKSSRRHFKTCSHILDWELFKRMIRFGLPNGVQFALDLASFNIFILALGRYGVVLQAASSIAFGLNNLAFTPMIGLGVAVSVLVGQSIGARDIPHAIKSVKSARNLILLYLGFMATIFICFPELVLWVFSNRNPEVIHTAKILLKIISCYLLFDGLFIVYSSAIKAAGDTLFSMITGTVIAVGLQAIPSALLGYFRVNFWYIWACDVFYIVTIGVVFYWRYRGGKWQHMRVIEEHPEVVVKADGVD